MKHKKLLYGILTAAFWLILWQIAAMAVGKSLILPTPVETLHRLLILMGTGELWLTALCSLGRILGGYGLGVVLGTALAVLCVAVPLAKQLLTPLRSVIRATPVSSFIILALLWLTTGTVPIFIVVLMVVPILWSSVETGIRQVDKNLLEMAHIFRFGKWKTLIRVYIPSVFPFFLDACTSALGFAWKSGIAAEVLSTPHFAIGSRLYEAKIYLEIPDLFAWTVLVILLSILLEKLLLRASRARRTRFTGGR